MPRVPEITSPCPLRWSSMPRDGHDHCGHCDRQVHNLDGMSTSQRESFMSGCQGKVCVAYTVHARKPRRNIALGAGLIAALVAPGMAVASEPVTGLVPSTVGESSPVDASAGEVDEIDLIFVGGVEDPRGARWADEAEVAASDLAEPDVIAESDWLPSAPK
ncbi:MAG: hypothetical protein ACREO3_08860 [Arenimonas sp.]